MKDPKVEEENLELKAEILKLKELNSKFETENNKLSKQIINSDTVEENQQQVKILED